MSKDQSDLAATPDPDDRTPLVLKNICLDLETKATTFKTPLAAFLRKHGVQLGLQETEDIVTAYLEKAWPNAAPGTMILSHASFDEFDRWIIRPPVEGPQAGDLAASGLVPTFSAYRRQGTMVIDRFTTTAHIAPRAFERRVSATIYRNSQEVSIEPEDLALLAQLPNQRRQTNEILQHWRDYLDWKKRLVFMQQLALRYYDCQLREDGHIVFRVHRNGVLGRIAHRRGTVFLATSLVYSLSTDTWTPIPQVRPTFVRAGTVTAVQHNGQDSDTGSGNESQIQTAYLVIEPEEPEDIMDNDVLTIPSEGFLVSAVGGEMKPIHSERRAIERLCRNQGHNWYLADYLFNIRNAGVPAETPDVFVDSQPFASLNKDQRTAVNKALAGPDIVLLEGPPGTGKTTVIVETSYQEVKRGHRVLVVSQANTAVDNVLSRLGSEPAIRPLRIGKAGRIEPEGRHFLAENVVGAWLPAVSQACEQRLSIGAALERRITATENAFSELEGVLASASQVSEEIERFTRRQGELMQHRSDLDSRRKDLDSQIESSGRLRTLLAELSQPSGERAPGLQSSDLLGQTNLPEIAVVGVNSLGKALSSCPWEIPWLRDAGHEAPPQAFATLSLAHRAVQGAEQLVLSITEAIALCAGTKAKDRFAHTKEMADFLKQRARLLNSSADEDLLKVARINRRIKQLQTDGWGQMCRTMVSHLQSVFAGEIPPDLDHLTCSLGPDAGFRRPLKRLAALCASLTGSCRGILDSTWLQIAQRAKDELAGENAAAEHRAARYAEAEAALRADEQEIDDLEAQLARLRPQLEECQSRWRQLWPNACGDLGTPEPTPPLVPSALEDRRQSFARWLDTSASVRVRNAKWRAIQTEWTHRLGEPQVAQDKVIGTRYVANANIVGLTCLEAGQRSFYESEDFQPFDVVIIDEVSKATPIELLMAMMLGRKVVLVGDHRQLPPMFKERESSYAEALEDGRIEGKDFKRFESLVTASFFQALFENADEAIRQWLFDHYRSHEQIMAVFNLFYENRLRIAGGADSRNKQRQHYLAIKDRNGGWFLEPDQHVLWIDSTTRANGCPFYERQAGCSKVNLLEVDLVIASLMRLNWGLRGRGYGPSRTAEAKSAQNGRPLQNWVSRLLSRAKDETIADLFARRQVRINGHIASADSIVRKGDTIALDARMPIGIITFYGAQLGQIRSKIAQLNAKEACYLDACNLQTNTVDKFQGKEMPIVIVSLVRAPEHGRLSEFVKEYRRINVAFSRAQNLLIIVGSERTFRNVPVEMPSTGNSRPRRVHVYRQIFDLVTQYGGRRYARDLLKW